MAVAANGSAQVQGELWSPRARDWAEVQEHNMSPVYRAVLDLVHAGPGVSVLEVGCGGGTALRLAADRGADVTALDAAAGMVEQARRRVPGADIRVGDLQFLPYEDATFDVVMGFNSFQYAADPAAALADAGRVLRTGGLIAVMVWGPADECDLALHLREIGSLLPPPPPGAPGPFALSEPGALQRARRERRLRGRDRRRRSGRVRLSRRGHRPARDVERGAGGAGSLGRRGGRGH